MYPETDKIKMDFLEWKKYITEELTKTKIKNYENELKEKSERERAKPAGVGKNPFSRESGKYS